MPFPHQSPHPAAAGLPPREATGIRESVREIALTALRHLQLRWMLLGAEAGQATGHLVRVALVALLAALGAVLFYLTGWAALVLWAARRWTGGDLVPPLAAMAAVHGLAAGACLWWLAARARHQALFAATRAEFAEDQKWLNHPNP